jgi:transposase
LLFVRLVVPTELEALELERTASVARYIDNWALARCQQYDQQHGRSMPRGELSAELTQLKQAELWLYDFDSQMLQPVLADLGRAYINFFERRARFPRFKTKKRSRPACRIRNVSASQASASMCRRWAGPGFGNRRPSNSSRRALGLSVVPQGTGS